jgi:hypothetical protein
LRAIELRTPTCLGHSDTSTNDLAPIFMMRARWIFNVVSAYSKSSAICSSFRSRRLESAPRLDHLAGPTNHHCHQTRDQRKAGRLLAVARERDDYVDRAGGSDRPVDRSMPPVGLLAFKRFGQPVKTNERHIADGCRLVAT